MGDSGGKGVFYGGPEIRKVEIFFSDGNSSLNLFLGPPRRYENIGHSGVLGTSSVDML